MTTKRLEASIVGICNAHSQIIGSGFLAAKQIILTCTHVVRKAGYAVGQRLTVRFHANGAEQTAEILVDGWQPEQDVAVLKLLDDPPTECQTLRLRSSQNVVGLAFRCFGYPQLGDYQGIHAGGQIDGLVPKSNQRQMLQLASSNLARGHSGAPVLDAISGQVVGMVAEVYHPTSSSKHRDTAFGIPSETLWAAWPTLRPAGRLINPFFTGGRINDPTLFFGRQRLVREIRNELKKRTNISIVGASQIGKSSLLYYLYKTRTNWLPNVTMVHLDLQSVLDEADFCEELLGRLGQGGNSLRQLKRALSEKELVLLLDEVERLAEPDFNPRLHDLLRSLAQEPHFALCLVSQRPLIELFPARTPGGVSPFHNIFTAKQLQPFPAAEARSFLQTRLAANGVLFEAAEITDLLVASGGHPAKLQQAAKQLFAEKVR